MSASGKKQPSRIFEENEIDKEFGTAYDHDPSLLDGAGAGEDNDGKIRILQDWYLTVHDKRKKSSHRTNCTCRRFPIPTGNYKFKQQPGQPKDYYKNVVLAGWLQPAVKDKKKNNEPTFIELDSDVLNNVRIHCNDNIRGLCVSTESGVLYWLQRPDTYCDESSKSKPSSGPHASTSLTASTSQSDLHLHARVGMGIVSNLLDIMKKKFHKMSIQDLYKHFSTKDDDADDKMAEDDDEPFDMDMLGVEECRKIVYDHLSKHVVADQDCALLQSLADFPVTRTIGFPLLPPPPANAAKRKSSSGSTTMVGVEMLENSAQRAEIRSKQNAWGERLVGKDDGLPTKMPPKMTVSSTKGTKENDIASSKENGTSGDGNPKKKPLKLVKRTSRGGRPSSASANKALRQLKEQNFDDSDDDNDDDNDDDDDSSGDESDQKPKLKKQNQKLQKEDTDLRDSDDDDEEDEEAKVDRRRPLRKRKSAAAAAASSEASKPSQPFEDSDDDDDESNDRRSSSSNKKQKHENNNTSAAKNSKGKALFESTDDEDDDEDDEDEENKGKNKKKDSMEEDTNDSRPKATRDVDSISPNLSGEYSAKNMKEALFDLRRFLRPDPKRSEDVSTWKKVQTRGFCVVDDLERAAELFSSYLKPISIHGTPPGGNTKSIEEDSDDEVKNITLEMALLLVESIRTACMAEQLDVVKRLFQIQISDDGESRTVGAIVFEDWREHAIALVKKWQKHEKDDPPPPAPKGALYLLVVIMNLIADCQIIKKSKQLETLNKRGIDWENGVKEVVSLNSSIINENLSVACLRAKKRLERITNGLPSSSSMSKQLDESERSRMTFDDEDKNGSPENTTAVVPEKEEKKDEAPSEQDDEKRIFEEERRSRLLAMMKNGSANPPTVSKPKHGVGSSSGWGSSSSGSGWGASLTTKSGWGSFVDEKPSSSSTDTGWGVSIKTQASSSERDTGGSVNGKSPSSSLADYEKPAVKSNSTPSSCWGSKSEVASSGGGWGFGSSDARQPPRSIPGAAICPPSPSGCSTSSNRSGAKSVAGWGSAGGESATTSYDHGTGTSRSAGSGWGSAVDKNARSGGWANNSEPTKTFALKSNVAVEGQTAGEPTSSRNSSHYTAWASKSLGWGSAKSSSTQSSGWGFGSSHGTSSGAGSSTSRAKSPPFQSQPANSHSDRIDGSASSSQRAGWGNGPSCEESVTTTSGWGSRVKNTSTSSSGWASRSSYSSHEANKEQEVSEQGVSRPSVPGWGSKDSRSETSHEPETRGSVWGSSSMVQCESYSSSSRYDSKASGACGWGSGGTRVSSDASSSWRSSKPQGQNGISHDGYGKSHDGYGTGASSAYGYDRPLEGDAGGNAADGSSVTSGWGSRDTSKNDEWRGKSSSWVSSGRSKWTSESYEMDQKPAAKPSPVENGNHCVSMEDERDKFRTEPGMGSGYENGRRDWGATESDGPRSTDSSWYAAREYTSASDSAPNRSGGGAASGWGSGRSSGSEGWGSQAKAASEVYSSKESSLYGDSKQSGSYAAGWGEALGDARGWGRNDVKTSSWGSHNMQEITGEPRDSRAAAWGSGGGRNTHVSSSRDWRDGRPPSPARSQSSFSDHGGRLEYGAPDNDSVGGVMQHERYGDSQTWGGGWGGRDGGRDRRTTSEWSA